MVPGTRIILHITSTQNELISDTKISFQWSQLCTLNFITTKLTRQIQLSSTGSTKKHQTNSFSILRLNVYLITFQCLIVISHEQLLIFTECSLLIINRFHTYYLKKFTIIIPKTTILFNINFTFLSLPIVFYKRTQLCCK